MFFWATVSYIAIYLAMHLRAWYKAASPIPVYNVLVATLQLIASRFYASAETPYNLVLIGILAARGWYFKIVLNQPYPPPRSGPTHDPKVPGYCSSTRVFSRFFLGKGRGVEEEGLEGKKKARTPAGLLINFFDRQEQALGQGRP